MLLVFHSKACADVLMLSHHAAPILRLAGKVFEGDAPARGVFTAAALSGAIAAIEQATAQEAPPVQTDEASDPVPAMNQAVSLRVRAWPLLDMLRRAQKKGVDVLWYPA